MTVKRRSFFMNSLFRILVSLVMAVILSLNFSFYSYAVTGADGDFNLNIHLDSPRLVLTFFNNFTEDGSDRASSIPYIFTGHRSINFSIERKGTKYNYVSGKVFKKVVFTLSSQATGMDWSVAPVVYIENTSLPDGVKVSIDGISGNASSFVVTFCFSFTNLDISRFRDGSFTVGFNATGTADANYFGASYAYLLYGQRVAPDWSGNVLFGQNVVDLDAGANYFYSLLNNQYYLLQNVYLRQYDIYNKIVDQIAADRVNTEWLAQQIYTDLALQNGKMKEYSQNEIDAANKNADDIMHSYDSGSQQDDNNRFDDSQKELQVMEDNLFSSATGYFDAIDFSSYLATITTIASSLSFVSGLLQQMYIKSGVFGMIVTISLVVLVASKIIGLYRFSTGDGGG